MIRRLIEAAPRFVSEIPEAPARRRYAVLLGIALELALLLPFAAASPSTTFGLPAAFALAVGTVAAVFVGPAEGVVVTLAAAAVFVTVVDHFRPGGLAALAVWPALVLAAGLFSRRVTHHRRRLETQVERANEQLRALVDTGIGLSSELDLDQLLQRLVEAAPALTGARYAALGLVDRQRGALTKFVTTGFDEATAAQIGDPPKGRGVLGLLIGEPAPIRLADVSQHPASVGVPPGHPPMRTFLGVPILLRGVAYGNLYLAEKEGGTEFTRQDEELLTLLAAQAAVAIENARLYDSASRWSRQLESLTETSSALSAELELPSVLQLVAESLRELLAARTTAVWLPSPDGVLRVAAAAGESAAGVLELPPPGEGTKTWRVFAGRRPSRVDSLVDDPEVDNHVIRALGFKAGLWMPLAVGGETIGVLTAYDKDEPDRRFADEDARLAAVFAARAAAAIEVARRVEHEALRQVVAAQEGERRRLADALHDGTAQALASILLQLRAEGSPELDAVRGLLVETLKDVRRMAVELHPKTLEDFGLVPALRRLTETFAGHTGIDVRLEASEEAPRLSADAETALYRIVQEALGNVARHASAAHASVLLLRRDGRVSAIVEDDGRGFDPNAQHPGYGLSGIRERVGLLGGTLVLESRPGAGTTLVAEIPFSF